MSKEPTKIVKVIADIEKRLDSLEELTLWLIRPPTRFRVGQRVRLSSYADRKRIKFNKGVRTGKVTDISEFGSIEVLVDGQAKPRGFFHGFWEPVRRTRLSKVDEAPRVKLIPITSSWTCPECAVQNVVGAHLLAVGKDGPPPTAECSNCCAKVTLGARRESDGVSPDAGEIAKRIIQMVIDSPVIVEVRVASQPEAMKELESRVATELANVTQVDADDEARATELYREWLHKYPRAVTALLPAAKADLVESLAEFAAQSRQRAIGIVTRKRDELSPVGIGAKVCNEILTELERGERVDERS